MGGCYTGGYVTMVETSGCTQCLYVPSLSVAIAKLNPPHAVI